MTFQVTVRYGTRHQRYHTYQVEADAVLSALRAAADALPDRIAAEADLVEIRPAPDPGRREYVEEDTED